MLPGCEGSCELCLRKESCPLIGLQADCKLLLGRKQALRFAQLLSMGGIVLWDAGQFSLSVRGVGGSGAGEGTVSASLSPLQTSFLSFFGPFPSFFPSLFLSLPTILA